MGCFSCDDIVMPQNIVKAFVQSRLPEIMHADFRRFDFS